MAKEKKKVPNLRFKGFTDDWEQHKLGEVAEIIGGGTPSTKISNYWNGDINWYTPAEISNFIYTRKSKRKISMEGLENSSARLLPVGTVLFTSRAGIGKTAILSKEGTTNQGFQSIVPNKKLLDSYFIFSLTNELKKYGETHGAGSTFIEISGRELAKAPLNLPALKEQKNISLLHRKLDNLISLQQRKLDLLKQLKKGLLQKMFADKGSKRPILRFEGFNDDWEGRKLENSADYIRGSFPQPYGNKEWYGGTNAKPFVQVVDVNTNMRLNKKTKEQISVLAQPKSRFVPSDSIVVTLQGSIGRVAITQYDSYVDRTLLIFTKYKVPVDKYFWAYSIQNIFRIEKQKAPGGTIKTITKRALSSFEVSLPVQEEQKKIGTLLKNIDDIITSQQEEVSKLKKIKKSLLQQMFI